MLRKSIYSSEGEPSFFYLMMADSCFRRAASTDKPGAIDALRDIGRNYLLKATEVTSVLEPRPRQPAERRPSDEL
jgi:hypothetical protein